jgi:outer membrane protein assembly factor BamD (BamD/ComL family)
MSELHDALTDIQGVGDVTAGKIIETVERQSDAPNGGWYEKAKVEAQAGNYETAGLYLSRAIE